jgi:hypothetical protein
MQCLPVCSCIYSKYGLCTEQAVCDLTKPSVICTRAAVFPELFHWRRKIGGPSEVERVDLGISADSAIAKHSISVARV